MATICIRLFDFFLFCCLIGCGRNIIGLSSSYCFFDKRKEKFMCFFEGEVDFIVVLVFVNCSVSVTVSALDKGMSAPYISRISS